MYKEHILKVIAMVTQKILDCLEGCEESMTFAVGRRVVKVFAISLGMLVLVLCLEALGVWCFVSWQEALCCSSIALLLSMFDVSNKSRITKMTKDLREVRAHARK